MNQTHQAAQQATVGCQGPDLDEWDEGTCFHKPDVRFDSPGLDDKFNRGKRGFPSGQGLACPAYVAAPLFTAVLAEWSASRPGQHTSVSIHVCTMC